jgi:membrane associated rhomboid family serine protease
MSASLKAQWQQQVRSADVLQRLLFLNVAVFGILHLVHSLSALFLHPVLDFAFNASWLAVPAYLPVLAFKPWTLITYQFFHWDFIHLLFNMLWLYWMGRIFQEYLGAPKLLATYLLGGLAGAGFYILFYNVFPIFSDGLQHSFALGASASVLAVTIATATLLPDYPLHLLFFGAIRLKWIALITVFLDLISISGSNAGGHIAHLGGACFGFVYIRQLQAGRDLSGWLQRLLYRRKGSTAMRVKYRRSDEDFIVEKKSRQERLDEILDKINRSGYGSLSKEEQDFLFKASKDS